MPSRLDVQMIVQYLLPLTGRWMRRILSAGFLRKRSERATSEE